MMLPHSQSFLSKAILTPKREQAALGDSLKIDLFHAFAMSIFKAVFQSLTSISALISAIFLAPVNVIATRISLAMRSSILATPFSPSVANA